MTTTEPAGYRPPEGLVLTPAMRAADDAYRDELRAQAAKNHDDTGRWYAEAWERLDARLAAFLGRAGHERTT